MKINNSLVNQKNLLSVSEVTQSQKKELTSKTPLTDAVKSFSETWISLEKAQQNKVEQLPKEFSSIIKIQNDFQKISLQTQIASYVAESFSSTIKKVQQMQ